VAEAADTDRGTTHAKVPLGFDEATLEAIAQAFDADNADALRTLLVGHHYADIADLLESLSAARRVALVRALGDAFDPDILIELDETVRDEVLEALGPRRVAEAVAELESDDAVEVLRDLDADNQRAVLDAMPVFERTLVQQGLTYPEDSAGRLMQREAVTVPQTWTVGQTIDFLRQSADEEENLLPELFYEIYVVDPRHHPVGRIGLSRLLRTRRPVPVTDILDADMRVIDVATDQETVAFLFRQRDLVSAPVIDAGGRLVGVITIDDVVDVIDEEAEEDIMLLGGVGERDLFSAVLETTRHRAWWLAVNLMAALTSAMVISLFQSTIEQAVALAVLMPIVASMGGNAGIQTLTVAVRGLATREITPANALRVVNKEVIVGTINGVLFAIVTGTVAWLWFGQPMLGLVLGLAMVANLIVAGMAGAAIPLTLNRLGYDPALGSGVFLTTVTDVVGFFAFLGLAAWILL